MTTMLGYMCETHGYQSECDVAPDGERICPECGMAVTGLTGRARSTSGSPPEGEPNVAEGDIEWSVRCDHDAPNFTVEAFDYEEAIGKALSRVNNPQSVKEVQPQYHRYRA